MSHKIMIIAEVMDGTDYELIQDFLVDFPEILHIHRITATQEDTK